MIKLKFSLRIGILVLINALTVHCAQPPVRTAALPARPVVPLAAGERTDRENFEARGVQFAVSTQGKYATQAAKNMYHQGGNIIDATVAASFVLAVERPQSTGIGGGGFLLFRQASSGQTFAVDFRERAPLQAREKMYVDPAGHVDASLSRDGVLAAAVPGLVAGLLEIHKKFGKLSLQKVMAPAIELAEKGFPIYSTLEHALQMRALVLAKDPAARAIFLDAQDQPWPEGHILVQKDLAATLRLIAQKGRAGFYSGHVASQLISLMKARKGLISQQDLKRYQVKWDQPLRGTYNGYEILSMPPPSSGGVHVIQFLNLLENDHLASSGFLSKRAVHLAASALQDAFADRSRYLGDPDFVHVPVKGLTSKAYAKVRRAEFPEEHARKSEVVTPGQPLPYESTETTHLSVMDVDGNAVSSTQTINGYMGSGVVVPGTGIVLNNEMDDFSAQNGASNMFGAVGGASNAVAPRKTPLSSMSPTLVVKDGHVILAVGAPGGTRIISCVAETILNRLEFQLPLYESVAAVRYHHQWQPDVLTMDPPGPSAEVVAQLKDMGYAVELRPIPCNVMAVELESPHLFHAVADPRDIGTSYAQ